MPKGLRHCFGVAAIQSQVPLNMVQRWLGHADMRTTAIYASAVGPEERSIAQRMWRNSALKLADASIDKQPE
ncbi:tyrosine-type recombinase/integrase [Blastomonas fulva]|uniref:tyrosine-type recombinase/integrase n=1 Tax=Blastomonas fulva TaxID=1550728 RepID=UPI001B861F3C